MKYVTLIILFCLLGCGKNSGSGATDPTNTSKDVTVLKTMRCTLTNDSKTDVGYEYEYIAYSNGDALESCTVDNSTGSHKNSISYTKGNYQGYCSVAVDLDTPSGGVWNVVGVTFGGTVFDKSRPRFTYYDTGSSNNAYYYQFTDSNCQIY
jgi:hypothetical protein